MSGFYAQPFPSGWIEVVCGSMYCGKTEELIRRVRRAEIARQKVQAFKPIIDTRYYREDISSHTGLRYRAVRAEGSAEICGLVEPDTQVVAIDEVQFFDEGILDVVQTLADAGRRVICAGLDMDFRGEPFAIMPRLLAMAEMVEKLTAICVVCGAPATRSQRLIDGRPAKWDDPIVLIGASDSYEPRCRKHHEVPVPPDRQLALPIAQLADTLGRSGAKQAVATTKVQEIVPPSSALPQNATAGTAAARTEASRAEASRAEIAQAVGAGSSSLLATS